MYILREHYWKMLLVMERLGNTDRSHYLLQSPGPYVFCFHIWSGSDGVSLNFPPGICHWHVHPLEVNRILRFGRLQSFLHLGWWATCHHCQSPTTIPHDQPCLRRTVECASFKLSCHQELRVVTTNSLVCAAALHVTVTLKEPVLHAP